MLAQTTYLLHLCKHLQTPSLLVHQDKIPIGNQDAIAHLKAHYHCMVILLMHWICLQITGHIEHSWFAKLVANQQFTSKTSREAFGTICVILVFKFYQLD